MRRSETLASREGLLAGKRWRYHSGMREEDVTFTFLEDGFYLPSIGVVLPEGEYRGRITRDAAGKLVDVMLLVPRSIAAQLSLISTQFSIISDYRSGLVREDRQ